MSEVVEPRIVEAVAVSGNSGGTVKSPLAKLIEHAMSEAVRVAYAEGVTDPLVIRERMQDARVKMRDWYRERERQLIEEAEKGNLAG